MLLFHQAEPFGCTVPLCSLLHVFDRFFRDKELLGLWYSEIWDWSEGYNRINPFLFHGRQLEAILKAFVAKIAVVTAILSYFPRKNKINQSKDNTTCGSNLCLAIHPEKYWPLPVLYKRVFMTDTVHI